MMDIVHVVADYERVVTSSIRCNVATMQLLTTALGILREGGTLSIAEEYIDRSLDALADSLNVMRARP